MTSTMNAEDSEKLTKYSEKYIEFTYENPTPYHVVDYFHQLLVASGFMYLPESVDWSTKLTRTGKYFTSRSGTCLIAFVIGKDWTPDQGIACIGAHIDAITTKLKPVSKKTVQEGYELLGVANVRVALSDKWWDRDLAVGGRVVCRSTVNGEQRTFAKLINSAPQPIAHIASLAPHFGVDREFNPETEKVPIVGYDDKSEVDPTEEELNSHLFGKHSLKLLRFIAQLAGVKVSDLYQLDLDLYDVQKGTFAGLEDEFIFAPRMDDKICGFAAMQSLLECCQAQELPDNCFTSVALFDNEEIGSLTRQGAKGGIINSVVERVISSLGFESILKRQLFAQSILLSFDVTHLYNPNFESFYLKHHRPYPNIGIAVDIDANGHMSTDKVGLLLIESLLRLNGDNLQYSQGRNDRRTGNTIGPMISSQTGARTVEISIAQLSMHSIRAACGSKDIGLAVRFLRGFFRNWRQHYNSFDDLLN